jgi:hypothetical protein
MLTPGNRKLGAKLIWGFGLPSGRAELCTGMTALCRQHCYARRLESYRPSVLTRYEENYRLSQRPDFEQRLYHFLLAHDVHVVRIHSAGEFYGADYARKWLRLIRRLPQVRFFAYTRAWRDEAIRPVLELLARRRNCRLWYSCDRHTGIPTRLPPRVRLAWLMTAEEDLPPTQADLIFRIVPLRRLRQRRVRHMPVCPAEDGVPRRMPVTCERCGLCWIPLSDDAPTRLSLPVRTTTS